MYSPASPVPGIQTVSPKQVRGKKVGLTYWIIFPLLCQLTWSMIFFFFGCMFLMSLFICVFMYLIFINPVISLIIYYEEFIHSFVVVVIVVVVVVAVDKQDKHTHPPSTQRVILSVLTVSRGNYLKRCRPPKMLLMATANEPVGGPKTAGRER